jgi:D-beta-D-heptose 7-phosphate kinase/D-beta-D-heptose 1-phosphate adenosyltransferase
MYTRRVAEDSLIRAQPRSSTAARLDSFEGVRVLCVGDAMLDRFVYGRADRVSPEAPIPVLRVEHERAMPGGAANVARNAVALGAETALVALVGADDDGAELRRLARATDGLLDHMVEEPERPTTVKLRFIGDGQQLLRADREANHPASADATARLLAEVDRALPDCRAVLLSDYGKGVLSDAVLAGTIERARAAGVPVIADPKRRDFGAYRGVDWLKPNERELRDALGRDWSGDEELVALATDLAADCGLGGLLVTRSERGMTVVRPGREALHLASEAREIFDVSGAGDTVLACLGVALGAGEPVESAARLANLAGGIAVGKRGTATVGRSELRQALRAESLLSHQQKVLSAPEVVERVAGWRNDDLRVGFTNGCFDLLHPGHVALLDEARAACDRLVVALNSDASVRRLKGEDRPIQGEDARAIVLASLAAVDAVVIFEDDTPLSLIEALRPDVLVKGADYTLDRVVGAKEVESWGGRVLLVELRDGHSTTGTLSRIGRG